MVHRHLMAVCVVCLLCADHLPCKEHFLANNNKNHYENSLEYNKTLQNGYPLIDEIQINFYSERTKSKVKLERDGETKSRRKRHAENFHSHQSATYHRIEMPEVTKNHLDKIFHQFNNINNQSAMNLNGFEKLIAQLKLQYLFSNETVTTAARSSCMNQETFLSKIKHEVKDHYSHDHHEDHEEHEDSHDLELSRENFMSICPILLYYVLNQSQNEETCFDETHFNAEDINLDVQLIQMEDRKLVWLYSTLTVVIVSLCGLCGIIVIPIMDKHFYHLILQFLVALAIGTMTGDALLHLLPHAMLPLTPDQDLHTSMMYRGLITFGCIVFSYFFERFIAAVMECRQRKERREKKTQRIRVVRDTELQSSSTTTCKHKYSSFPYCYDEINIKMKEGNHHHHNEEEEMLSSHKDNTVKPTANHDSKISNGLIHDNSNDVDNNTLTLSTSLDDGSIESNAITYKHSGNPGSHLEPSNVKTDELRNDELTVILR